MLETSPFITNVPLNLSKNPISISPDLVATSAAIIAASPGVIVSIPIACVVSVFNPSFLQISLSRCAIKC